MGALQQESIRLAKSMEVFADGEPTFVYGHWREWKAACEEQGRTIPPAEFKAERKRAAQQNTVSGTNPSAD